MKTETIRDKLWLWCHHEGSHNSGWGIPGTSKITPYEAVSYLNLQNLLMVRYLDHQPSLPFDKHAAKFKDLNKVVWSTVGSGGISYDKERTHVYELASKFPNISGLIMDDFFKTNAKGDDIGVLSVEDLEKERIRLKIPGRTLNLWVVLYDYQLNLPVKSHLELCDTITFWTWEAKNLTNLNDNFKSLEDLATNHEKILGCYMWDYGQKRPISVDQMEMQCELGLEWLQQGRIDGMIFLASCICDLDIEAVEWTKNWIEKVGNQNII